MNIKIKNEYETINEHIKNEIKESFRSVNEKRNEKIILLNKNEICNELNKEIKPILFYLNNNIKYSTLENYNEIKYFELKEKSAEEIKNKIFNLNSKINSINNKIKYLNEINSFDKISFDSSKRVHEQIIFNINARENMFKNYYKKIKKNISNLEQKQEVLSINMKNQNNLNHDLNSLNNIRQNIKALIESAKNDIDKKFYLFKEMMGKTFSLKKIKKLKDIINSTYKNTYELKKNKDYIPDIIKLKSIINKIIYRMENSIFNQIKLSLKENNELLQEIITNHNNLSNFRNNVQNNLMKSKKIETKINKVKMSSFSKNEFENFNSFTTEKIYNLNQSKTLTNYEYEKLSEYIDKTKKLILNYITKKDFYNYVDNVEKMRKDIEIDLYNKIIPVEEFKNCISNLLKINIRSRKNIINKIDNEKNNINSRFNEIKNSIKKEEDSNNKYKQNLIIMEKDLDNYNLILKKISFINNKTNQQKEEINEFNNKLNEIDNFMKNLILNNITYQSNFRKSINKYIYENKKQENEFNRKNILIIKETNNLKLYLNNYEKNVITNKKSLINQIDNFIKSQHEINKRIEEYFKYNNKINKKNRIDTIKKLKEFKNIINKIISRFIRINDKNNDNKQKITNLQKLLNKRKIEINEEFDNIKIYLNDKLKNV